MIHATNRAALMFNPAMHARSAAMHGAAEHGQTTVKLKATAKGFEPKNIAIPAGKTVNLVVDVSDAPGCAKSLAIPSLSLSQKADSTGKVTLTIPPQKVGHQLPLQCSMAMFKATITVTD